MMELNPLRRRSSRYSSASSLVRPEIRDQGASPWTEMAGRFGRRRGGDRERCGWGRRRRRRLSTRRSTRQTRSRLGRLVFSWALPQNKHHGITPWGTAPGIARGGGRQAAPYETHHSGQRSPCRSPQRSGDLFTPELYSEYTASLGTLNRPFWTAGCGPEPACRPRAISRSSMASRAERR